MRWVTKGGLAIMDQGLISGSNFLISILLARWLAPESYGAFALAFSVFLFLSYIYQAFLAEPQGVFSGSAYSRSLRGYLKALLSMHMVLTVVGVVLLGGTALIAVALGRGGNGFSGAMIGVAIASPCILFFWLMRRAFYMNMAPARSAIGALLYSVISTGGLFAAYKRSLISPFSAYLLMAIAALGTGLYLLSQVKKALPPDSAAPPTTREAWKKHWEYGRWALAVSVVTWIPNYMYYPLVTSFFGIGAAGQLRAIMNLSLPLEQSYMALSILFLPWAARRCKERGPSESGPLVGRITLLFVGGALAYWAILIPLGHPAFQLLYKSKYIELIPLLPYVALGAILWAASFGPAILLRALEAPDSIFYSRIAASVLSIVVGIPATRAYGLKGVVWSLIIANFSAFWISLYILRRKARTSISIPNPVFQGEG